MSVVVHKQPGPIRQIMAMIYDFLLLLSALLFAAIIPVSLNGGEAITPVSYPLLTLPTSVPL